MSSFFAMLFTVMMLFFSVSSLPLSIGAGENAVAVPTLFVTIYFVFMLVSVLLREKKTSSIPCWTCNLLEKSVLRT